MRFLADTRLYPPSTYAGAELALHNLLRDLVKQGHEATVVVREGGDAELDGVDVWALPDDSTLRGMYDDSDVILTHLEGSLHAQPLAAATRKPLVHLVHNDTQLRWYGTIQASLVIFNSSTLAAACAGQHPGIPSVVLNPPIYADDVTPRPTDYPHRDELVDGLQISLSDLKGGYTFWRLAARETERRFAGVVGGYGEQIIRGGDNVIVLPHQRDLRRAYASTRVLLVPSAYETWGRVAVEAMANGLPIIAHPSPGLGEAIGSGGVLWAHRDDPAAWSSALAELDNPELYDRLAAASADRFANLQDEQNEQLDRVTLLLEGLA